MNHIISPIETGQASIRPEAYAVLDTVGRVLAEWPGLRVEVAGHTDSQGTSELNLDLSKRRAEAVTAYIGESGFDTSRITSAGYGETKPVAGNDTPEGRAQNRRIEFVVK